MHTVLNVIDANPNCKIEGPRSGYRAALKAQYRPKT